MQKQISAIISLKDRFSQPLLKMSDNIKSLDKETRSSMNRVNRWGNQVEKSMDRALKSTIKWAKRSAVVLGGLSFKKGMDGMFELDDAARKVQSISGGQLQLDDIKSQLHELQFMYNSSTSEFGDAWYDAISASVPIEQSVEVVELAYKLSKAGFTDVSGALRLLATSANAFDTKSLEDFNRMADQALLTQNKGVILVGDMVQGYGAINKLSSTMGLEFAEQSAGLATMTQMGMNPAEAITSYKAILNAFLTETSDSTAAKLESLGLGADFLSAKTIDDLGFGGALKKVMEATQGDLDEISKIFKNIRGKTGATIFTGTGMETYDEILDLMKNGSEGALDDAFETVEGSISNQWGKLKKKLKTANEYLWSGTESPLGDKFKEWNEYLEDNREEIIEFIDQIHEKIGELIPKVKELLPYLASLLKLIASLYIVRKVAKGFKKLSDGLADLRVVIKAIKSNMIDISAFSGLTAPEAIFLIIAAIVTLRGVIEMVTYAWNDWEGFSEEFPEIARLIENIGDAFESVGEAADKCKYFVEDLDLSIKNFIENLITGRGKSIFRTINNQIGRLMATMKIAFGWFQIGVGVLTFDLDLIKEGIGDVKDGTIDLVDSLADAVAEPFNVVLDLIPDEFEGGLGKVRSAFERVKNFIETPLRVRVKGVIDSIKERNKQIVNDPYQRGGTQDQKKRYNYKGTPSWSGGYTYLHERGGELVDLPDGTRIYPHNKSLNMAMEDGMQMKRDAGSSNVALDLGGIHFHGDIKTDSDINRIGTQIATVIKKELANI